MTQNEKFNTIGVTLSKRNPPYFLARKNMNLDTIPSPLRIRIFVTANGLMGKGGVVAN